jgi:transcriptional regulator with XRE-family HTH domain
VLRAPPESIRNNPLNNGSDPSATFTMESLGEPLLALDELAKLSWLRHDQSLMPEPLPLIISLKRWREANGFSQSEAVKVLNQTGIAVTLDSLQNWESGRRNPRASVALALADFLRQNPKAGKNHPGDLSRRQRRNRPMEETQEKLKPLTSIQLLDAAIWREIGSDQPQPPEAFTDALSRLLARWMLTRSQASEMETLTTLCKTHAYVLNPEKIL